MKHSLRNSFRAVCRWSVGLPLALAAQTADLPYSSGSTGADGALDIPGTPSMRYQIGAAYDAEREQVVVFGGAYRFWTNNGTNVNNVLNQTWLFDGERWTQASPAAKPIPRMGPAMAFDPVRREVLLFGGYSRDSVSSSYRLGDTWAWDGSNWSARSPGSSPPADGHGRMVWDVAGNRLLYVCRGQTWAWDGSDWTDLAPTNPPPATDPRYLTMAYDAIGERVILFDSNARETYEFADGDWTEVTTENVPPTLIGTDMVYDPERDEIVLHGGGGTSQTWIFKDSEWTQLSPATAVSGRSYHAMVFAASAGEVYAVCGDNGSWAFQDTGVWNGTDWVTVLGRRYTFDMTGRPDGIWNFTSIDVPPYTDVYFEKNSTNTAVTWLATENVSIAGRIILSGQSGAVGVTARGGPGGFDGGRGGVPGSLLGLYAGSPGAGPGGGAPGVAADAYGASATHRTTYGNALVQPPTGGSGGGGGAADDGATGYGGEGGAGGGAFVLKSSKDIQINSGGSSNPAGGIFSNGGNSHRGVSNSYGGAGSGGSIRVVGDRVGGDGTLQTYGGYLASSKLGGDGWIRVESYFRPFDLTSQPAASVVSPVGTIALGDQAIIRVISVAGTTVPQPPAALIEDPDVIFANDATPVSIVVQGTNVPVGTVITLTIETPNGPITLPAEGDPEVTLGVDGLAVFDTELEEGHGTIRAFANYQLEP